VGVKSRQAVGWGLGARRNCPTHCRVFCSGTAPMQREPALATPAPHLHKFLNRTTHQRSPHHTRHLCCNQCCKRNGKRCA
jgi:hypothetical protein